MLMGEKTMNIIKMLKGLVVATVIAAFSMMHASADSKKPTRIPVHNWSSQVVMAHVIGGIIKDMGGNVEYVPADSQKVYESIRIGDIDISHEVWQSAFGKSFDTAREKGGLLDWGDHEARTLEDMGYPNWVAEKGLCPGLPNWEALNDCAEAFATVGSSHEDAAALTVLGAVLRNGYLHSAIREKGGAYGSGAIQDSKNTLQY